MAEGFISRVRRWAAALKRDATALALALRDPRVGLPTRLLAGAVVAYALSPIDLIPDFIPVLGLVDDLILVPLGLWLVARVLPPGLLDEYRAAAERLESAPRSRAAAVVIVALWIATALGAAWLLLRR